MWIQLPDGNTINMNNISRFYPSPQYTLIKFILIDGGNDYICHFKSNEERDKYLVKLHLILDAKDLNETVTL